ncbi:MAG TPA: PAS domain-containing protein [Gallionellaceae bacterium]
MNLHSESNNVIELTVRSFNEIEKQHGRQLAERHEPPTLVLDEDGMIKDCSKSAERLFGYRLSEIIWQHISCLFPQFQEVALIQKGRVNPKFNYIAHCGHIFQGLNKQGLAIPTKLNFICLEHDGFCTTKLILRPSCNEA